MREKKREEHEEKKYKEKKRGSMERKKRRETHRKVHCAFQLSKEQYGIAWIKARVVHEKSTRRVVV